MSGLGYQPKISDIKAEDYKFTELNDRERHNERETLKLERQLK